VTDIVKKILESATIVDRVIAIGPPVMMRAVAGVTKPFNVKTIVSLNSIMVDGTRYVAAPAGCLWGTRQNSHVWMGRKFDAHLVDFTLLMNRLAIYQPEEKLAFEKYKCERRDANVRPPENARAGPVGPPANFNEVTLGFTGEQAIERQKDASSVKKPKCVEGCPVEVRIPDFHKICGNR